MQKKCREWTDKALGTTGRLQVTKTAKGSLFRVTASKAQSEHVAPPPTMSTSNSWVLCKAVSWACLDGSSSRKATFTSSTRVGPRPSAQTKQSSISLSYDSRGQCTLINVFHYYARLHILYDGFRKKETRHVPWGKKLRPYQGIKNNKSHANLLQPPYYPTPFQNIVHLD